jgi:hypothetical protein
MSSDDDPRDEMPPGIREFGDRLVAAAEQRSSEKPARRRFFGRPLLLAGVVSVVVAGGAGAAALISIGEPAEERTDAPPNARDAGTRILAVEAKDPGGKLPWGASVYGQTDGKKCIIAGHLYKGQLGMLRGNEFRAFSPTDYGACGRPDQNATRLFVATGPARGEPDRGLAFGRVADDVKSLRVRTKEGVRNVPLGSGGAFLLVFDGAVDLDRLRFLPAD